MSITTVDIAPGEVRRFRSYPEYSGVGRDWLGPVASGWRIVPLRHVFDVVNGSTPKTDVADYWDGNIPWVTPEDLGGLTTPWVSQVSRNITESGYRSCGTTLVPTGSLILSTRAPIGHVAIATTEACTNQGCRSLINKGRYEKREYDPRFWYYQVCAVRPELESLGQGSTFKELSRSKLLGVALAYPPIDERSVIADFLDRETAKIDALVAKKQRLIELLQEQRGALSSRYVTVGIAAGAPLTPARVESLGEVPSHWRVLPLKRVAQVRQGAALAEPVNSNETHAGRI